MNKSTPTVIPNAHKKWILIDAENCVLGRLSSFIANRLRGKHLAHYTPNLDYGDNVIVINAAKMKLTGKKAKDKNFYWHTGYPGGIKQRSFGQILEGRFPARLLQKSVERMVPRGPLGRQIMSNLRIFAGQEHSHVAQLPEAIDFGTHNKKNIRG